MAFSIIPRRRHDPPALHQKTAGQAAAIGGGRLCSQKTDLSVVRDPATNPLNGWHANLILLQRRQCVLFVHDATRFPVFVPALKKADFAELDWHFQDSFMNTLLKVGADDNHMKAAEKLLAPLLCDSDCYRSVQGTLNQMEQDLGHIEVDPKNWTAR